ncbi:MAG: TusE/DsrC/DsvC family sulfur relay protein [Gammaproteobacteria bacterium]
MSLAVEYKGKSLATDPEGFLLDPDDWNREIAILLAKQDGIDLSESHWEIIDFCRGYYQEYRIIPIMRILVKAISRRLGIEKGKSRYLYRLFPQGPVRQASRYAGLPKPPSCI